ncbi:pseudouridine synthase [Paracoccus alkenifer]|uniref:Pseudouridine synthase n=1 Tax=Paracoccus alkenifer TaxID=65735 RepID=A0A1H6L001_9RHOB|nr:pseudouridine synthase [Paracoccus alkenifer]SEH81434.1 23S rRNA pseudouridine2605 synthase [Paracoccus alkenifer]
MTDQTPPENDDDIPQTPPATEPTEPTPEVEPTVDSAPPPSPPPGERIAKVMARAGVASRREAERMIIEGRVSVNGRKIASPALDILPTDQVRIDGKPMEAPQETRLWLYYKPVGLVTSESDEKGRQTVFDALPRDLPRVMSVGRLDLNSEGLLLLTNDGELKRRLELPATAWLRRYRVRVNGNPTELTFDPLRRGATIDREDFAPMEIRLDSQQGANAWLTVGIREGRNREIRRAMAHVGLQVNRLIRIGYGPFKLAGLEVNEVREVKRRILRDQLGGLYTGETEGEGDTPRRPRASGAARDMGLRPDRAPRVDAAEGERPARKPRHAKDGAERAYARRDDAPQGERRPDARPPREAERGARPFREQREGGFDRKPRHARDGAERAYARRDDAPQGERRPDTRPPREAERGARPFREQREGGFDRKPRHAKDGAERPYAPRRSDGDRPERGAGFSGRSAGAPGKGFSATAPRGGQSRPDRGDARTGGPKGFGARDGGPRGDAAGRAGPKGGGFKPRGAGPKTDRPGNAGPQGGPRGNAPGGGPRGGGPKASGPKGGRG